MVSLVFILESFAKCDILSEIVTERYEKSRERYEMQISICDDEKEFRTALKKVIEREMELEGIACEITEYKSGEEH